MQVGYDCYTDKYNTLGGELYALKRAYQGAGVFNPKKLRELPVASLEILIDLSPTSSCRRSRKSSSLG